MGVYEAFEPGINVANTSDKKKHQQSSGNTPTRPPEANIYDQTVDEIMGVASMGGASTDALPVRRPPSDGADYEITNATRPDEYEYVADTKSTTTSSFIEPVEYDMGKPTSPHVYDVCADPVKQPPLPPPQARKPSSDFRRTSPLDRPMPPAAPLAAQASPVSPLIPQFSERIVIGAAAEPPDVPLNRSKEEEENLLNEELYQVKKFPAEAAAGDAHSHHDDDLMHAEQATYAGVWEMKTGGVGSGCNVKLPLVRPSTSSLSSDGGDRVSCASFDEPPPSFPPPPLPPPHAQLAAGGSTRHLAPPPEPAHTTASGGPFARREQSLSPTLQQLPLAPAPPPPPGACAPGGAAAAAASAKTSSTPAVPPRAWGDGGGASAKTRPPMMTPLSPAGGGRSHAPPTPAMDEDLTALKVAANQIAEATCAGAAAGAVGGAGAARDVPPVPPPSSRVPNLDRQASNVSEQNAYSPTLFPSPPPPKAGAAVDKPEARRKAPSPPPKKENPFKSYYDSESGTYSLEGQYSLQGAYDDDAVASCKSSSAFYTL